MDLFFPFEVTFCFFSYLMPITPRHLVGFTIDSHVHLYPHAFSKLNHSGFAFVQFEEPSQDI